MIQTAVLIAVIAAAPVPTQLTATKSVALPGVTGPAFLDYLVYEPRQARVWVPVGNSGSVDVFDVARGVFTEVGGFASAEREVRGEKRIAGPSAAAVGDGVVYIGDRASNEVCAVETATLTRGDCLTLPTPTDGVAYVASTREVWVTTPHDQSLSVLDAQVPGALKAKTVIKLDGQPEGYAVDEARGLFFTNLEDKDRTVAIDLRTRQVRATWKPGCGDAGPRGVVVDSARGLVIVACTDHLQVLDATHDGAALGRLEPGHGIDNIDWRPERRLLYVAAGKAARLTVARVDEQGQVSVVATATTAEGARNAVADGDGNAYVADPANARLLVYSLPLK